MKNPLIVSVTQADIDAAQPHSSQACAIARALRRDYGYVSVGPKTCTVATTVLNWTLGEGTTNYMLPPNAQEFISDFDSGLPVGPFTFIAIALGADQ